MEDTLTDQQHASRVGISRNDYLVGNLGEIEHSFGFGAIAKFSTTRKFLDYGALTIIFQRTLSINPKTLTYAKIMKINPTKLKTPKITRT